MNKEVVLPQSRDKNAQLHAPLSEMFHNTSPETRMRHKIMQIFQTGKQSRNTQHTAKKDFPDSQLATS